MTKILQIQQYVLFKWGGKKYLCVVTDDNLAWVFLPPLFGKRVAGLKKKYDHLSFQHRSQFTKFSFRDFSHHSVNAVFLSFFQFEELVKTETCLVPINIFYEQLKISKPSPTVTTLSRTIPTSGFIYFVKFPKLNVGKIGITENWQRRLKSLRYEYDSYAEIIFHHDTKNARELEATMLTWLKSKNAMQEISNKKGQTSRETFSLIKISETDVREKLLSELSKEKNSIPLNSPLTDKLTEESLKYDLEVKRIVIQESYRALSPEKRDEIAIKNLLQFSSSDFQFLLGSSEQLGIFSENSKKDQEKK